MIFWRSGKRTARSVSYTHLGDSYSNDRHRDNGTIIRNGIIYRAQKTDMETCVLNWDGTMQIYAPDELDTQTLIDSGAYQLSLIHISPKLFGGESAKTPVAGAGFPSPDEGVLLRDSRVVRLGEDFLIESEVCGNVYRNH